MPNKTDRKKSPKHRQDSLPKGSNQVSNPFKEDVNLNFDQQFPRRLYPVPGPCGEL